MTKKRIYIAGHKGMVGSALQRQLGKDENNEIITRDLSELDLANQQQVADFFSEMDSGFRRNDDCGDHQPDSGFRRNDDDEVTPGSTRGPFDEIYLAAAKVGGIHANHIYPAEFIYENLAIECNIIHQAWRHGVKKLLFLGSSCIYPRLAEQPIKEVRTTDRPAGTHQRALRHRQDRRHQAVRIVQPPVRHRLPQRHAHQPVWPG